MLTIVILKKNITSYIPKYLVCCMLNLWWWYSPSTYVSHTCHMTNTWLWGLMRNGCLCLQKFAWNAVISRSSNVMEFMLLIVVINCLSSVSLILNLNNEYSQALLCHGIVWRLFGDKTSNLMRYTELPLLHIIYTVLYYSVVKECVCCDYASFRELPLLPLTDSPPHTPDSGGRPHRGRGRYNSRGRGRFPYNNYHQSGGYRHVDYHADQMHVTCTS